MEKPAHSAAPRRHQLQPGEPACSYQNTWSWDSHSHTATPVILSPKSIPGFSLRTRLTAKLTSVTRHLPSLPVLQAPGKGILPGMCPVKSAAPTSLGTPVERKTVHTGLRLIERDLQEGQRHEQRPDSTCRAGMAGKAAEPGPSRLHMRLMPELLHSPNQTLQQI